MEEITPQPEETGTEKTKRWFQDNLRIIVSVVIVIVIAGGIYSYSKRSETPATTESVEEVALEEEGSVEVEGEETTTEEGKVAGTDAKKNEVNVSIEKKVVIVPESKETETSFIESPAPGEGATHLARRALANYLAKNTDSSLTKEHKIYIEDYLRKNASYNKEVSLRENIEFNKDLIKQAIEKSKSLNENQLKNLEKYSVLVVSMP